MKIHSFFTAWYLSFFSKNFYRSILQWAIKDLIIFILIIIALCHLPVTLLWMKEISSINLDSEIEEEDRSTSLNHYLNGIIAQIPLITITKGKVSIEEKQPYFIYNPITHDPVIIIDTSGTTTSLTNAKAEVLITKDEIFINKKDRYQISSLVGSKHEDPLIIDQESIKKFILNAKKYLLWLIPLIFFPALILGYLISHIFTASLYALCGLILFRRLAFDNFLKLALAAKGPVILIKTILEALVIIILPIELYEIIVSILSIFYFGFALKANMSFFTK